MNVRYQKAGIIGVIALIALGGVLILLLDDDCADCASQTISLVGEEAPDPAFDGLATDDQEGAALVVNVPDMKVPNAPATSVTTGDAMTDSSASSTTDGAGSSSTGSSGRTGNAPESNTDITSTGSNTSGNGSGSTASAGGNTGTGSGGTGSGTGPPGASPPPADGRPWANNTGPTNVSALKPVYETIKVTEPGTIIENVDLISARIDIQASNVTVRNFRVDAGMSFYGVQVRKGLSNVVIENGEITNTDSAGVYCQSACTLRRLYIHDHDSDGMKLEGQNEPSLVEYNYITRLGNDEGSHADGNQSVKAKNLTFRYNNFYMPYPGSEAHDNQPFAPGVTKYKSNANFIIHDETDNILIEHNWLNGGNYTIYGNPGTTVRNNIFGNDFRYGICNGPFDDWSGNVMEDGSPAGNNQTCD